MHTPGRHGTGHGVGAALNVHEGPQSISSRFHITTSLAAHMVGVLRACSNLRSSEGRVQGRTCAPPCAWVGGVLHLQGLGGSHTQPDHFTRQQHLGWDTP